MARKSTKRTLRKAYQSLLGKSEEVDLNQSFNAGWTQGFGSLGMNPGDRRPDDIGKDRKWLREFSRNPRFSGLHKIVSDNGVSDFMIKKKGEQGEELSVINHPLEKEIKSHTAPMFFSLWTAYRLMTGVVYIAYDLVDKQPANLKIFTSVHLTNSVEGGYYFQYGDKELYYPNSQVIVDYDLELTDPYNDGRGRATSISDEVELDSMIVRYLTTFYYNSAQPAMIISPKGDQAPSETDLERLVEALNTKHKGLGNAHRTAVLTFDANIDSVPNNHREMELLESRRALRDASLQHFGIPPEIMGIVENSNKATVVAAEHIYAKQVRMPILTHFQDVINQNILPRYAGSEGMELEFDNILPDDEELNIKKGKEGREGGTLLVNEHRKLLGFPPLKGDAGNSLIGNLPENIGPVEVSDSEVIYDEIDYNDVASEKIVSNFSLGTYKSWEDAIVIEEDENVRK